MTLLQEIRAIHENVRQILLKQIPVLIHCQDKNVDFQADNVDVECHANSELENQTLHVHVDSDTILDLNVTRSDLVSGQNTRIAIVLDLSNASIVSEGDSAGLKIEVDSQGQVLNSQLNTGQFQTQVNRQ